MDSRSIIRVVVLALFLPALFLLGTTTLAQTIVATVPVGVSPQGVAVNRATNRVYVVNQSSNSVSVIDGSTNSVSAVIPVGARPQGVAVNPATNRIYVANADSNTVSVIDGATNAVIANVGVGKTPLGVAVNPLTNHVYVGNGNSNNVSVINGQTNAVAATIGFESGPLGIAVNPVTNRIYVVTVGVGGAISVIDGTNNKVVATLPAGSNAAEVAVNPVTNRFYVTNTMTGNIAVFDGATNSLIVSVPVPTSGVPIVGTFGVAVNPATNRIYVDSFSGTNNLVVLDGATNSIVATVPNVGGHVDVAVNWLTNRVYVPNQKNNSLAVIQDQPASTSVAIDASVSTEGDTSTINISVTNITSGGINYMAVRGSIPPGATLVSTSPTQSQVIGNEVVWFNTTSLGPGETLSGFQYTVRGGAGTPTVTVDFIGATRGSSTTPAGIIGQSVTTDEFTETLIRDLTNRQFRVSQGYPILYAQDACPTYTYPLTKNCWFNNPAAPYVVPIMKTWPDEYLEPSLVGMAGATEPGYSAAYRLDQQEAIVIYGQLPPPGKYTGLQTFMASREGRWKAEDYDRYAQMPDLLFPIQYLFDTIPPDDPNSERVQSMSALSNLINNVVIERQSGASFGQTRYFVITPDANMDKVVRAALQDLGVPDSYIFTEPIPPSDELGPLGPFGLGQQAPDFFTAIRYAVPDPGYEQAAQAWRANPPFTVLRVRAAANQGAAQPFPPLTFDPRTAVSELGLASDLQSLVNAVCDRAGGAPLNLESGDCADPPPDESIMTDPARDLGWVGPYCRAIGMDCLGDQQEASYFFSSSFPLDSGEVYAVVGTLATSTGNATYAALSVNDTSVLAGVANVLDTVLEGSAASYAASVENHDKFFVHYFTRDCTAIEGLTDAAKDCTAITEQMVPARGDTTAPGDPALHGQFNVGLRDYVRPGTARGPDSSQQLRPRILMFTVRGS